MCEKSYMMGRKRNLLRGHYNPTPKKKKKANLQWTNLHSAEDLSIQNAKKSKTASKRRILVCTRCLKTLTKKASPGA